MHINIRINYIYENHLQLFIGYLMYFLFIFLIFNIFLLKFKWFNSAKFM
jgi:hypothetical protein